MARLNIDQVNILLMIFSCLVAFFIPFELLLISYAFLGPAHYLTEISWLQDRQYFTGSKWIWLPLSIISASLLFSGWSSAENVNLIYFLFSVALALSAAFILAKTSKGRMLVGIGFLLFMGGVQYVYTPFTLGLVFLLPTVIHVYIFTGLFILLGALKGRSAWGGVSLLVYLLCALSFLFIIPSTYMISTEFVDRNLGLFDPLVDYLTSILSLEGRVNEHTLFAFLSFAYTYHYLNWFSKTEVIKWHLIPRKRAFLIVTLYIASVGLYLIDYKAGVTVLLFLSIAHVILEFPLNFLSIRMIAENLSNRGLKKVA